MSDHVSDPPPLDARNQGAYYSVKRINAKKEGGSCTE